MSALRSPGGQTVELLDDTRKLMTTRATVLRALWHHGPIEDHGGLATETLHRAATANGYRGSSSALSQLLHDSPDLVEREIRGKRCFRIELVALPASWVDRLELEEPEPPTELEEPPTELELEEEPEPELEEPEPWDLEIAGAVATSLLTRVVEIINAGRYDADGRAGRDLEDARRRLYEQTEYAEKLRRQVREVGDELAAVKHERDGLRSRLRLVEENLRKATGTDVARQVDALVREQLDRVMRARPAGSREAS